MSFEDTVAEVVDPMLYGDRKAAWYGRSALRDQIYPSKFNGRLLDITLTVMDQPYDRLLDAQERGWRLNTGGSYNRESELNSDTKKRFAGFIFSALAKSTGRPALGLVQSELWYFPIARIDNGYGSAYEHLKGNGGRSVIRVVTKPRLDTEIFELAHSQSKKIGYEVLRQQMLHPIPNGMHN